MVSVCITKVLAEFATIALLLVGCSRTPISEPPIDIKLFQNWQLQRGDKIGDYTVLGALGDITLDLKGNQVYAPFDGRTQLDKRQCVIFSSPNIPAYRFRLCGIDKPRLGSIKQGDSIGSGNILQFAALREQPDGKWAIVEPEKTILERTLTRS